MIPTTTMAPLQSHSPVQGWVLSEAKSKASNTAQLRYPRYPDPFQKIGSKNPQLRFLGVQTENMFNSFAGLVLGSCLSLDWGLL